MKIGNVEIKGMAALAPMAGVTDRAFRELCVAFGASYVVGEMVSAKGISFNSERSKELMLLSEMSDLRLYSFLAVNHRQLPPQP